MLFLLTSAGPDFQRLFILEIPAPPIQRDPAGGAAAYLSLQARQNKPNPMSGILTDFSLNMTSSLTKPLDIGGFRREGSRGEGSVDSQPLSGRLGWLEQIAKPVPARQ